MTARGFVGKSAEFKPQKATIPAGKNRCAAAGREARPRGADAAHCKGVSLRVAGFARVRRPPASIVRGTSRRRRRAGNGAGRAARGGAEACARRPAEGVAWSAPPQRPAGGRSRGQGSQLDAGSLVVAPPPSCVLASLFDASAQLARSSGADASKRGPRAVTRSGATSLSRAPQRALALRPALERQEQRLLDEEPAARADDDLRSCAADRARVTLPRPTSVSVPSQRSVVIQVRSARCRCSRRRRARKRPLPLTERLRTIALQRVLAGRACAGALGRRAR